LMIDLKDYISMDLFMLKEIVVIIVADIHVKLDKGVY
jgi:hypothetical protein